jgi:hypothetical protein
VLLEPFPHGQAMGWLLILAGCAPSISERSMLSEAPGSAAPGTGPPGPPPDTAAAAAAREGGGQGARNAPGRARAGRSWSRRQAGRRGERAAHSYRRSARAARDCVSRGISARHSTLGVAPAASSVFCNSVQQHCNVSAGRWAHRAPGGARAGRGSARRSEYAGSAGGALGSIFGQAPAGLSSGCWPALTLTRTLAGSEP